MARSASVSHLGSEFNNFLYAPIGEDRNGMLLSVLSALARLDIDPWQEAAKLAALPGKTATQRLAALIATLPDEASAHLDAGTIAARLIALLPRGSRAKILSRKTSLGVGAPTISPAALCVISCVVFMAFILGAQFIAASRSPPAQAENVHAPGSGTVSPPTIGRPLF
jgi:hypothetical protein